MAFSAKDVQTLRERTGVGMMECKKALTEADGDMEKAIDILRERGLAAAAKKAGRIAAEGAVYAFADAAKKIGVVVEVNSETDFVAKNPDFQAFVEGVAGVIADQNPADVEALLALPYGGGTVESVRQEKVLVIGENISVRRFTRFEGDCVAYVHGGGRIGVLALFEAADVDAAVLAETGKDVAMQVAALNPLYQDREQVPAAVLEHEKELLMTQIRNDPKNASKPANIVEKMVEGRVGKYFETNCLLQQPFVKDGNVTVAQYLAAQAGSGSLKLVRYERFERGEGLQKREDNFADEVAGMVK